MTEYAAHGTEIALGTGTSPVTYTAIARVSEGPNGLGEQANFLEARPHDSTSVVRKPTYVTVSPLTFTILYDPANTQHAALVDSVKTKAVKAFRLTTASGEECTFNAYVSYERSLSPDGWEQLAITLTPEGDVTIAHS
jgi:hypothetical protein